MTHTSKLGYDWVENVVEKGENAGDQHFLLFLQCFQRPSSSRSKKTGLCGKGLIKSLAPFETGRHGGIEGNFDVKAMNYLLSGNQFSRWRFTAEAKSSRLLVNLGTYVDVSHHRLAVIPLNCCRRWQ